MTENENVPPAKSVSLVSASPTFDLKSYDDAANDLSRDIFSLTPAVTTQGNVDNTPKGELPDHLKIVGIVVAHPSQIIIEDSSSNKTYFINEGTSQDGISIVKVSKEQMIINYQGQDIPVPVSKY